MLGLRILVIVALLTALLPQAVAQAPSVALEIADAPTTPVISMRGVAIVSLNVTLRASGIVCASASDFSVQVVGASEQEVDPSDENATAGNATVNVTPGELEFPVAAGAYGNNPGLPAAQPYESRQTVAVSIESAGLPNLTQYQVQVRATLQPASTSDCRGSGAIPSAEAETTFPITFNNTGAAVVSSPEIPVPWQIAPIAACLACVLFRRRP